MLQLSRSKTTTPARLKNFNRARTTAPFVPAAKMGGEEAAGAPANGAAPKRQRTGHEGHSTVVILDYGSQYSQLITRRVREIGVFSVMLPGDADMVRGEGRGGGRGGARETCAKRAARRPRKKLLDRRVCRGQQLDQGRWHLPAPLTAPDRRPSRGKPRLGKGGSFFETVSRE